MNHHAHPPGFYKAYPEVTWDIAEDRWRGSSGRSDVLFTYCRACGWGGLDDEPILAKPERMRVAEFIAGSQHWYQCPGNPQIQFTWILHAYPDSTGKPGSGRHSPEWRP